MHAQAWPAHVHASLLPPSMSARPVRVLVTNSLYVVGDEARAQVLENDGQKLNLQVGIALFFQQYLSKVIVFVFLNLFCCV